MVIERDKLKCTIHMYHTESHTEYDNYTEFTEIFGPCT